nr:hypothetical protein [Tanacetum cinerariifolium]
ILQFVLLGLEDRRGVPDWILRLANDRDGWDKRYPRVVALSSKRMFYRHMLYGFFHRRLPIERLTPDEIEARSDWWVSSMAYFDGRISEAEQIPRHEQGGPSSFPTANNSFFEGAQATPSYGDNMAMQTGKPQCHSIVNILNREKREVRPNMYRRTPYMDLPPTTVLPKKRGDKNKNKVKNANVSPLNLRSAFADENV